MYKLSILFIGFPLSKNHKRVRFFQLQNQGTRLYVLTVQASLCYLIFSRLRYTGIHIKYIHCNEVMALYIVTVGSVSSIFVQCNFTKVILASFIQYIGKIIQFYVGC
jgi:accessory gene regulator protein AgrB